MRMADFVLVDISNSFTKIAFASHHRLGRVHRLPTKDLSGTALRQLIGNKTSLHTVAASVVPAKNALIQKNLPGPVCWVSHKISLGIGIDYPKPESIGADRLANAVAVSTLHGTPAIVVDFGTAVTFDIVSEDGVYLGGVIAPGLGAMTDYLHKRTALLPRITLSEPHRAIGRSTKEAMKSGAVHGYRGLVTEILRQILREIPTKRRTHIVATGGDAQLIAGRTEIFSAISPTLTLEGLRLIGCLNFPR